MPDLSWMTRDAWLMMVARTVRTFSYGFLAVLLPIYLITLGYGAAVIGGMLSLGLGGASVAALASGPLARRWGRRRVLMANALLMTAAGVVLAVSDQLWLLLVASATGTLNVTQTERGAFGTLDQAVLPQTAPSEHRTNIFAMHNIVGGVGAAFGALASGIPALVADATGMDLALACRPMYGVYAAAGLVVFLCTLAISAKVEVQASTASTNAWGVTRSGGVIAKLAAVSAVDSFGGGFVPQSIIAYWFHEVHGLQLSPLAPLFAATSIVEANSYWVAARLAKRLGLLNTMVFTHLPSNILLMLIPFMPTAELAIVILFIRQSLSQMDVPTRQSYTMAVVDPEERVAAASITTLARAVALTISPGLSGLILAGGVFSLPFVIAGALKVGYDITLFFSFRSLHPPEEAAAASKPAKP